MTNNAIELIENEMISETEIIDLLSSTSKLIKIGVFNQKKLDSICEKLGIKQLSDNTFELNEDNIYILK